MIVLSITALAEFDGLGFPGTENREGSLAATFISRQIFRDDCSKYYSWLAVRLR